MEKYIKLSKCFKKPHALTLETINQSLVGMPMLVKSKVYMKYMQHKREMEAGITKPFQKLLPANTGDAQSYGQPPITFLRQVLASCLYPKLISDCGFKIPEDAKKRAQRILHESSNKAIMSSQGMLSVRKHISQYIIDRDGGGESSPDTIFIHDSRTCIDTFLSMIKDDLPLDPVGLMLPVPCYPMFMALAKRHEIQSIPYYLDGKNDWSIDVKELRAAFEEAKQCCRPKGIVVINPGNPTGNVLSEENMEDIVKFCYNNHLFLIADEVYQNNIYDPKIKFASFKKIKRKMKYPFTNVELVSLNSASKGFIGECGLRGAYVELDGFNPEIEQAFRTGLSINKCANLAGQIAIDVVTRPPDANDPSYELFEREKTKILTQMAQKASVLVKLLNTIDGIRVKPLRGGLYAYATIENMPGNALSVAECLDMQPSMFWTLQLLDTTGVALVPGSSFVEKPGTHHFRITVGPSFENIEHVFRSIKSFHQTFLDKYK